MRMSKGFIITDGHNYFCGLMRVRKPEINDQDDPVIFDSYIEAEQVLEVIQDGNTELELFIKEIYY
jgi:hypothetical protein